ncbi:hypothetical protein ACFOLC_15865 [Lysobacter cavernae]|uniref:Uncharacterized protein n=1 Tax=Lysobacter cavernae TaxID=1685901 RepID=A0ABV7RV53_9GAMM
MLRYGKGMAEKACHTFAFTTQVGLTQALGPEGGTLGASMTHELTVQIVATVASALILATLKPVGEWLTKWAQRQTHSFKQRLTAASKVRLIATVRYCAFIGIGAISIPLNGYFLWRQTHELGPVTRIDVLEIVVSFAILVYWIVYTLYMYKKYSISDYMPAGPNNSFKPKPLRGSA